MNKKLELLEIKKLLQEYSFLNIDDEFKQEVIQDGKSEFLERVHQTNGTPPPLPEPEVLEGDAAKLVDPNSIDPNLVGENVKIKIKKLYREIVKLTHPDKTEVEEMVELYTKATIAADNFDLFVLYDVCAKLNITHTFDVEDRIVLKEHISKKKEKLDNIEKSFIWVYLTADTEEKKEELIKSFIEIHGENL